MAGSLTVKPDAAGQSRTLCNEQQCLHCYLYFILYVMSRGIAVSSVCLNPGREGLASPPPTKLATGTSRKNCKLRDSRSSRKGDSSMKRSGQSRKNPKVQMRTKRTPYFNSVISSQPITHVDPEKGRTLPCNFIKH